jgi:hypothetical protein
MMRPAPDDNCNVDFATLSWRLQSDGTIIKYLDPLWLNRLVTDEVSGGYF